MFAGKVELDPCPEAQDVKTLLAKSLAALSATQPDVSTLLCLLRNSRHFVLQLR